ncbi:hypothetical protein INR49_028794, partial [Caranx melampygus]
MPLPTANQIRTSLGAAIQSAFRFRPFERMCVNCSVSEARGSRFLPRQADGRVLSAPARLLCAAADLQKDLGEMVKKDKVVVFMKGTPAQPMCGFSNAVVQILRMHGVDDYAAYNVLEDQDLRQ